MAENNFKPFAVGAGANVSSQADWENLVALSTGFTAGVARSEQVNKALRQGTVMASVLGQIIADQTAEDVLDDGDTAALKTQLLAALTSLQIDSVYPVGAVLFFAQNKNPNTLFPGTTWNYIGENKTIRLGFQNGTDVLTTGGADTVTIAKGNLPAQALSVSGTAASVDLGTKTTNSQGAHSHGWGSSMQKQGGSDQAVGSNGGTNFGTTSEAGDHTHSVELGSHGHNVSGNTENMGSGTALNITNSYVKLMGWYRSA
ncbi:phage baseplate protein [Klebsiella pneumoniae]|uniref:phage baseplate protein n=1 Tax=Klebsiella pneumoniae TaxID=573 RepID=UPI003B68019A